MSPDELLIAGENLYLKKYRETLERDHFGFYAVFDVESEQYVISNSKLEAFERAEKDFGKNKLFFVVRVGDLNESTINLRENASLSWAV